MNSNAHVQALLSGAVSQGLQQALRANRTYVETLAEQSARDGSAVGFIEMNGEGEAVAEITFPIKFLQTPVFTCGLELATNAWLQYGTFPIWSATVGEWKTEPADGDPLYSGAMIGIVVVGAPHTILHYSFQAPSLTNPTGSSTSVSGTL